MRNAGGLYTQQVSPLVINKNLMKGKDIGVTTNNEIVVSEQLKNAIEKDKLTGVHFASVNHYQNTKREFPKYYQMYVDSIMPEIDSSTMFRFDIPAYCDKCKGHGNIPVSAIRYAKNNLNKIGDFNWTKERMGAELSGSPYLIVSKKTYDLWKTLKINSRALRI